MNENDVFVKLNLKSIGEIRSLIVDKVGKNSYYKDKYMMCAGKHDKNGWTIVFKAKNYKEAEYIIEKTKFSSAKNTVLSEVPLDISIMNKGCYA